MTTSDYTRVALAVVRLANGAAALLAPGVLAKRFGVDPEANPAALYVLRLFGVRTIVLGAELLAAPASRRPAALRTGIVIHAADATAALIAGATDQLPHRAAKTAAVVSTVNTALALISAATIRREETTHVQQHRRPRGQDHRHDLRGFPSPVARGASA